MIASDPATFGDRPRAPLSTPAKSKGRPAPQAWESERVVFQPTVQSLFSRLPPQAVSPGLKAALKQVGLDLDQPLQVAYPMAMWVQILQVTSHWVFPGENADVAHRKLGQRLIEGYVETAIGSAVFAFLKLIGPRRTLDRTAKAFRNGNNFCESKLRELAPNRFEVWINEVGTHPTFLAGVLQAGLTTAGARGVAVEVLQVDAEGMTYLVSWTV